MMLATQVPDAGTPIFNDRGHIDPVWHNFFSTILRRTGGSAGIDADESSALISAVSGVESTGSAPSLAIDSIVVASQSPEDASTDSQVSTHGQQNDPALHDVATPISNGFMSSADKSKLDSVSVPAIPPAVLVADVVTQNSTADGAVLSLALPAASMGVGSTIGVRLYGLITSAALAGTISVWIKVGATKVMTQTFTLPSPGQVNTGLFYTATLTSRTAGASGTMQIASLMTSNANALNGGPAVGSVSASINTTVANTLTIGWNWSVANAGNIATAKNATFLLEKP